MGNVVTVLGANESNSVFGMGTYKVCVSKNTPYGFRITLAFTSAFASQLWNFWNLKVKGKFTTDLSFLQCVVFSHGGQDENVDGSCWLLPLRGSAFTVSLHCL